MAPRSQAAGFTLVEVLVAMGIMALMALMSWRGIDAMLRTHAQLQQRADETRTLQAGLAQWQTDLHRLAPLEGRPAWDWDGKVLRLTREDTQASEGLRVVAWTWRQDNNRPGGGDWLRWQSPLLRTQGGWQVAWQQARAWSQSPTTDLRAQEINIHPLAGWQLFVHRGGSWAHPQSSDVVNTPNGSTATASVPDGVRLVLQLPAQSALSGPLTLDWVRPTLTTGSNP
jgi:general secretion pathway protein J